MGSEEAAKVARLLNVNGCWNRGGEVVGFLYNNPTQLTVIQLFHTAGFESSYDHSITT